jgi:hypothetical protein
MMESYQMPLTSWHALDDDWWLWVLQTMPDVGFGLALAEVRLSM